MDLLGIIREQQRGHDMDDVYMVGEQLLDIAEGSGEITELLIQDLQIKDMRLGDAAKKIREYAASIRKGRSSVCVPPKKAEEILRKFYGLPEAGEAPKRQEEKKEDSFIDLDDFL